MLALLFKYKAYLILGYAFLLSVHFIFKDRFAPFVFIFFACPLLFIIAYGFVVQCICYKNKTLFIILLGLNILLAVFWFTNYYYTNDKTVKAETAYNHAILYWNIARPKQLPLDLIFKNMKTLEPEIIVLVEAKNIPKSDLETFTRHYPDYQIKALNGEMIIAVKGIINHVLYGDISASSKYNFVTTTIQNHSITVLITDLLANPFKSKHSDLQKVHRIAKKHNIDFVIGDFNTPYESAYFKAFNTEFESFHSYNNGITATWPSAFPVLEIDQFWLNKRWQPLKLNKQFHSNSDHALLVGQFKLK